MTIFPSLDVQGTQAVILSFERRMRNNSVLSLPSRVWCVASPRAVRGDLVHIEWAHVSVSVRVSVQGHSRGVQKKRREARGHERRGQRRVGKKKAQQLVSNN